jgi:uncharacterized membrane protein YfhO
MKRNKINKKTNKTKRHEVNQQEVELFKGFGSFIEKNGLYILLSLIALIVLFVFRDFIFLHKTYLFNDIGSDSVNIGYPAFYSLADYIVKEGIPKWSFSQGMGQNIFPGCTDPFSLFIILMGKNHVYFTLFFAEAFKIFFAGFFFFLFLKKITTSNYTAIIGGVLFSFTGFIVLGGEWAIFSTEAVYVALLLYSFEKLYQDNNWILFPISICLIASNQPFDLYLIGLFLLMYVAFRLVEANEREPKKILILFTKLTCLGILGIAISSFFFMNEVKQMLDSPRVSGESSYTGMLLSKPIFGFEGEGYGKSHYLTSFMRFFSSDMLGTGSNFRGWYNYLEAPLFYCGLISLVLLPHFLRLFDTRKKIIYSILLLVFVFPVIFPFFRYSFWLFTGDYYRAFSLFVVLAVLLVSLKSIDTIDRKSRTNIMVTGATLFLLLLFLYYPYANARIIDENLRGIASIFLITYSVLIYLIQFKTIRNIVKLLLLFVIVIELTYFSGITVNKRPVVSGVETKQKVGYNDYTVDAVKYLKSNDKTFFRIDKDYSSGTAMHSSINDARAQDFYGTPSYHSFNQLNYIKFLQELGIIKGENESQTRWAPGLRGVPLLHSFASIKYGLSKNPKPFLLGFGYDSISMFGDVRVLKNKFALPLGFSYEKYIPLKDFKKLSQIQKMFTLYKAVVINDSIYRDSDHLTKFSLNDTSTNYSWNEYAGDIRLLSQNTLEISRHGQNEISGRIRLDKDKMLFLSIPFDKGWNVKVDGKSIAAMMVNVGFIGIPVEKGLHTIELSFIPPLFNIGKIVSLIAIVLFVFIIAVKHFLESKKRSRALIPAKMTAPG